MVFQLPPDAPARYVELLEEISVMFRESCAFSLKKMIREDREGIEILDESADEFAKLIRDFLWSNEGTREHADRFARHAKRQLVRAMPTDKEAQDVEIDEEFIYAFTNIIACWQTLLHDHAVGEPPNATLDLSDFGESMLPKSLERTELVQLNTRLADTAVTTVDFYRFLRFVKTRHAPDSALPKEMVEMLALNGITVINDPSSPPP